MRLKDLVINTFKALKKYTSIKKENIQQSYTESKEYVRGLIRRMKEGDGTALDYHFGKGSMGMFYIWGYNSKLYEEGNLPHYDKNPLGLILNVERTRGSDGKKVLMITACNFHWIYPSKKAKIIAKIIQADHVNFFNDKRIPGLNYKKFKTIVGGSLFKQCAYSIRRYRYDHVKIMASGMKIMRIKNTEIIPTLGFSVGIYEGCSKSEAMQAIRKAVNSKGGKLPPLKKKKAKKKKKR